MIYGTYSTWLQLDILESLLAVGFQMGEFEETNEMTLTRENDKGSKDYILVFKERDGYNDIYFSSEWLDNAGNKVKYWDHCKRYNIPNWFTFPID